MVEPTLTAKRSTATQELVDLYGRVHRSMRISITDKCQLRCTYCMPAEGLPWLSSTDHLSVSEIVRLAKVAYGAGFRDFRITGGEPLIRREVVDIVSGIAGIASLTDPIDLAMTTNGILLDVYAERLKSAGLQRVNVSLDTLKPERFATLTLRDRLDRVFRGLETAKAVGFSPIKLNTLLIPGVNDDEILDLMGFSLENGYELRFIEQMPLGGAPWDGSTIITQDQILATLASKYDLKEVPARSNAPAARWLVDGGPQSVGVIASVTRPFCGDCDRLRVTADGAMRNCLFSDLETDLITPMRKGATDQDLLDLMRLSTTRKEPGHLIGKSEFTRPKRGMSAIGG